jgi:hypothetical protein
MLPDMGKSSIRSVLKTGMTFSCALLCLLSMGLLADDRTSSSSELVNETLGLMLNPADRATVDSAPFQLIRDNDNAGLDFDLGGSETRKLQLQLNQPLKLSAGSHARVLDSSTNLLGLDATLDVPLGGGFSLTGGADKQMGKAQFQSLGSIRCMNGTLRSDSYTASGCRFVDEPYTTVDRRQFKLGTQYEIGNASASINWFTRQAEVSQAGISHLNRAGGAGMSTDSLLTPGLVNPLFAPTSGDPLQQFNSQASGVDLNFRVGFTTDNRGDIRLGLAFTRVLDTTYQGIYSGSGDPLSWTLAEPFNSSRMNIEWSKGQFSSGIQGFYRDSVDFLNRNSVDSLTTFDVHFTWRTPWNANLSVGASNVLNAGTEDSGNTENLPVDPLESIYGRIPYVRYKQDL